MHDRQYGEQDGEQENANCDANCAPADTGRVAMIRNYVEHVRAMAKTQVSVAGTLAGHYVMDVDFLLKQLDAAGHALAEAKAEIARHEELAVFVVDKGIVPADWRNYGRSPLETLFRQWRANFQPKGPEPLPIVPIGECIGGPTEAIRGNWFARDPGLKPYEAVAIHGSEAIDPARAAGEWLEQHPDEGLAALEKAREAGNGGMLLIGMLGSQRAIYHALEAVGLVECVAVPGMVPRVRVTRMGQALLEHQFKAADAQSTLEIACLCELLQRIADEPTALADLPTAIQEMAQHLRDFELVRFGYGTDRVVRAFVTTKGLALLQARKANAALRGRPPAEYPPHIRITPLGLLMLAQMNLAAGRRGDVRDCQLMYPDTPQGRAAEVATKVRLQRSLGEVHDVLRRAADAVTAGRALELVAAEKPLLDAMERAGLVQMVNAGDPIEKAIRWHMPDDDDDDTLLDTRPQTRPGGTIADPDEVGEGYDDGLDMAGTDDAGPDRPAAAAPLGASDDAVERIFSTIKPTVPLCACDLSRGPCHCTSGQGELERERRRSTQSGL